MKRLLAIISVLTISSCVQFHDQPLSATKSLDSFESRTLNQTDLNTYIQAHIAAAQWPLQAWDLTSLTLTAFFYHPDLDVARAQWAFAKAGVKAAGEPPNPKVTVSPGYNSTTESVSRWIVGAAVEIPIVTAGKRGYQLAQAEHLSEAARMHIAAVAWQVRSRVRKALLDLYGANETESLLIKRQSIQAQCLELLQQQLDAGEISGVVVNQASIDFHATVLELLDARKRQTEARVELADAIGVPVKAIDGIDILFNGFEGLPSTLPKPEARRQALLNRVDVLAALAVYQASQSSLQLEIARQYPDIDIGPGYEYDQGDNKWALGISLTLPVLNQNRGAIAAAEALRTEAAAEFTALQSHILGQIERAVAGLNASMDKARTAEVIAEKLEQKATTMQKMFEAGEVLVLAVAGARLEQNSNTLLLLRARIDVQEAVGQLEDAMQSPADLSDWRETVLQSDIGKKGTS